MSASLIGRLGSSAFRLSTATVSMSLTGSCFSSESAPGALPSWDSRTRRNNLCHDLTVTAGSKRTCELTSSIVPRGTSFHRSVELECPYWIRCCTVFMLLLISAIAAHTALPETARLQSEWLRPRCFRLGEGVRWPATASTSTEFCSAPTDTRSGVCRGKLTCPRWKAPRKLQKLPRKGSKHCTGFQTGKSMRTRERSWRSFSRVSLQTA